jgi:hypothetical protein
MASSSVNLYRKTRTVPEPGPPIIKILQRDVIGVTECMVSLTRHSAASGGHGRVNVRVMVNVRVRVNVR